MEEWLHVLNRIDDPAVQREVDEAMARMDAGQKFTMEDLQVAGERLPAEGR